MAGKLLLSLSLREKHEAFVSDLGEWFIAGVKTHGVLDSRNSFFGGCIIKVVKHRVIQNIKAVRSGVSK